MVPNESCLKESAFDQKVSTMADEIKRLRERLAEANAEIDRRDAVIAKWNEELFQPTKPQLDRPIPRY